MLQPPKTPSKAKLDEITKITNDLAAKWGLQFPVRDASWSPSKVLDPNLAEEQVLNRVRFLYFRDRSALDYAIDCFEKNAPAVFTQWKFKPHGEDGVLPRRISTRSSTAANSFLHRSEVPPDAAAAAELMKSLLHFVNRVAEDVKANVDYRLNHGDNDRSAESARHSFAVPAKSKSSKSKDKAPSNHPGVPQNGHGESSNQTRTHTLLSSSGESYSDNDVSRLMEDIDMIDAPTLFSKKPALAVGTTGYNPGRFERRDVKDTSVSPSRRNIGDIRSYMTGAKDQVVPSDMEINFVQKPELVPIPNPLTKKRRFPEPGKSLHPRKSSREGSGCQTYSVFGVNDFRPTGNARLEPPRPLLNYNASLSAPHGAKTVPNFIQSRGSFDSITSVATSTTASSFNLTSPKTSSQTDSFATSFDSIPNGMNVSTSSLDLKDVSDSASNDTTIRPGTVKRDQVGFTYPRSDAAGSSTGYPIVFDPMRVEESLLPVDGPILLEPVNGKMEAVKSGYAGVGDFLAKHLLSSDFLPSSAPRLRFNIGFRQLYEVTRVSLFCKLPIDCFSNCLSHEINDYGDFWSLMIEEAENHAAILPEQSSRRAWGKACGRFENVVLSADLQFAEKGDGPIFKFSLNPLKLEASHRLARKFGGDRICVVGVPGIERLPPYLKMDASVIRDGLIKLLIDTDISFLGRKWRAFNMKSDSSKRNQRDKPASVNDIKFHIYLFARDGDGFRDRTQTGELEPQDHHVRMEVQDLLEWFMPFKINQNQSALKFFARLALGVSKTTPTIRFNSSEVIRTKDARADAPCVRRLVPLGAVEEELHKRSQYSNASVMNDGCARISRPAALAIANILGLSHVPCAYQGRFGGAKGIWMIDALDEQWPTSDRNFWIEITDSQLKFKTDDSDPAQLTFEVNNYIQRLKPASLNFQLMPILAHQGVPESVFQSLLEQDLKAKTSELKAATCSRLELRKWNQENNPVTAERAQNAGIRMQGGLPYSDSEKINWFVEHGFEPSECSQLKNIVYSEIKKYCMRLEDRMNIGVGKSTYAFMIADPLAILEENEIHLGFSGNFRDPKDGWEQVLLHDVDALVARLPALLPSDVQKVRAVFKPELQIYKDVVVFSSKGNCSLAEKLSGGDYDGDIAWICWEPDIVKPFNNCAVPAFPPLDLYGIEKDETKVSSFLQDPNYTSKFLHHAFKFQFQDDMLGSCTAYHESLCYKRTAINDPGAIAIAALLGHLVDRSKTGIIFDKRRWIAFLKKLRLQPQLPKPAYKDKVKAQPTSHMIDRLVFITAKNVRQEALTEFSDDFDKVATWDDDLVWLWNSEREATKADPVVSAVLTTMKSGLESINLFWSANARKDDDSDERSMRKPKRMTLAALIEKCRADFLALEPVPPLNSPSSSIVSLWQREWRDRKGGGSWSLLKASALFHGHSASKMVWYVAGVELGELKCMKPGRGLYRPVAGDMFEVLKVDGKAVMRRRAVESGQEEMGEEEEDAFGIEGWEE